MQPVIHVGNFPDSPQVRTGRRMLWRNVWVTLLHTAHLEGSIFLKCCWVDCMECRHRIVSLFLCTLSISQWIVVNDLREIFPDCNDILKKLIIHWPTSQHSGEVCHLTAPESLVWCEDSRALPLCACFFSRISGFLSPRNTPTGLLTTLNYP